METISILCPTCGQGRCQANHQNNALVCQRCKSTFPQLNGVIDMLPEEQTQSFRDWVKEWPWIMPLYDSRLWLRNPLFERLTQISIEQEARSVLEAANLRGHERVLDLACGSGSYSRILAAAVPNGEVVALDLSLPSLEYAAQRALQDNLSNLRFVRTNPLKTPFPDNSFDVINCCSALLQLADVDVALAEVQRMLKPGGRFTTAVFRKQKGIFAGGVEWLSQTVMGAKSLSLSWWIERLRRAGLQDYRPYDSGGRWLIMRSTKAG